MKDKIIEDLRSEMDSLSTKVENLQKSKDQSDLCFLVHEIAEEKDKIT